MNGQQAFFEALLNPDQPPPLGLTTWNGSDPAARFAVYRNNVVVSLVDALADTYPVSQELVGEAFFRAMARLFVIAEPPRSRVLAFYGESFPAFIEQFSAAASVPYLADVARLEMLRVQAYHAADATELTVDVIAQALADTDGLLNLLLEFHPSVRLLQSQYAIVSLWAAHQGVGDISTIDPYMPESALIIRSHLDVEVIQLSAADSNFVDHLLKGVNLGTAVERASSVNADFDLASILNMLILQHTITSLSTGASNHDCKS